jgi:uncharacterized phage protein gp47/JayE
MAYTPKTIDDVQQAYFQALADANSQIRIDKTQGSVAYTLGRASAAIAVLQDLELKRLADSINLSTAAGDQLDSFSSFGIRRLPAQFATGTVLCLSEEEPAVLQPRTILTDISTGSQFVTKNTTPIIVSYLEVSIAITAVSTGAAYNLSAGTVLYAAGLPYLKATVGTIHTQENEYLGSLTGGSSREDDDAFRNRIASWLLSHTTASKGVVINRLLSFPGVTRAYSYTKAGGVIEIWVDSIQTLNASQKLELVNYLKPYISDGIIVALSQLTTVPANLEIDLIPFSAADMAVVAARVRQVITQVISQLEVGQTLALSVINEVIKPLAAKAIVTQPKADIICGLGEILIPGEIIVRYPIN